MIKLAIYNGIHNQFYRFLKNQSLHGVLDIPQYHSIENYLEWNKNSELHRLNGPAVIYSDGKMFWYENEKCIKVEQYKNDQT